MADTETAPTDAASHLQRIPSQQDRKSSSNQNNALVDPSLPKRPRDAHTIHTVLHHCGVAAYQERVPLQLMDFAYRYTSNILQDALHFANESYGGSGAGRGSSEASSVSVSAIRLAIHSRSHFQYNPTLPKEVYMSMMHDKNRVALPPVQRGPGMKLPPDQYLLTGQHWEMGEEFDLMDTGGLDEGDVLDPDLNMNEQDQVDEEMEGGRMEDIFGDTNDVGGKESGES